MSATPGTDFLTAKSDPELLFLVRNPSYYHPDLVQAARRELQRRGVGLAPDAPLTTAAFEEYEAPERRWVLPAVGGGLIVLALGGLFLRSGAEAPPKPKPAPPPPLVAVETHVMPAFDALTESQLQKMPQALPPGETRDTTARRKYLLLARRFWDAENQSAYIYDQTLAAKDPATLPGKVESTLDKWHRLTSVLVYNHDLQPGMTARVELMHQDASLRMTSLQRMSQLYQNGEFPLDDDLVFLNDSVQYLRQILLGVPRAQQHRPVRRHQDFVAGNPAAALRNVQRASFSERYSVYVVDGESMAPDPDDGAVPAAVRNLHPDSVRTIVAVGKQEAVRQYGPQAYNGALVITTRHPHRPD